MAISSTGSATMLLVLALLACSMSSTSAFSLQVYNDSACTVSLPNYSYTNSALNYTVPAPVCLNNSIASSPPMQSLGYQCSYSTYVTNTTARPLPVNLNLVGYPALGCAGNASWIVYLPGNRTTGATGGPEGVCTLMTLYQPSASASSNVYGVVSCAASNSNSAGTSADVKLSLLAALLILGSLLL